MLQNSRSRNRISIVYREFLCTRGYASWFSQVIYLFILIRIFLFHFYKRFPGLHSANHLTCRDTPKAMTDSCKLLRTHHQLHTKCRHITHRQTKPEEVGIKTRNPQAVLTGCIWEKCGGTTRTINIIQRVRRRTAFCGTSQKECQPQGAEVRPTPNRKRGDICLKVACLNLQYTA